MADYGISEPRLRSVLPFKAAPAEVRNLRKAARSTLVRWGVDPVACGETELAVSELATNVLKHVGEGSAATLVLESLQHVIRVEVHDESHAVPSPTPPGCEAECGRGLHLLAGMAARWGTLMTATGKAVWCELSLEPSRQCVRVQRAAAVLEGYRQAAGSRNVVPTYPVMEESVTDLIADLLHWLAAQGRDPDDILDRAQMHFEAEQEADVA
ncbi:ATP-binding protein [Streptomyces sp. NPDC002133]|uniref:ATP-binding protein n=1 Tax=Streptomyces sp. NPDC002133 TaxID=3154409 RepID=UPI003332D281